MVLRHLQESWDRTQAHLMRATALLPASPVESEEGGRLDRYRDWIEHNELELALDELEMLGGINKVPRQFWVCLRDAAIEMHLPNHQLRLDRRLTDDAG
jgi:hypothetical protein